MADQSSEDSWLRLSFPEAADRRIEDGLTCCAQGRGTHTSAAPGGRLGSDSGYGRLEIWLEFRGTPACPRR
jgi:hypothetical protein